MSTLDDVLSRLRAISASLKANTSLPGASSTNDNLSKPKLLNNYPPLSSDSSKTPASDDILSGLRSQNQDLIFDIGMPENFNPADITTYPLNDILKSGKFTAYERKQEYRRRGKSPSGVIDGEYNDMYRGNDEYNDTLRDWEADA